MIVLPNLALLECFLEDPDNERLEHMVVKDFRRTYSRIMPKKYWIFPQQPVVYVLSKSICIEFPSWGSKEYRYSLADLQRALQTRFIFDVQYFDGKTTFIIRSVK